MAGKTFWCADLHLGHQRAAEARPFGPVHDHDNAIIDRWNQVVSDEDTVFILGDLSVSRSGAQKSRRLNGKKYLVGGNHDMFYEDYPDMFTKFLPMAQQAGFLATHIPIHSDSVDRWGANVHGHLHQERINDHRYLCVSMEQINYTPVTTEWVIEQLRNQRVRYEEFGSRTHIWTRLCAGEEISDFGLTTEIILWLAQHPKVNRLLHPQRGNVLEHYTFKLSGE